MSGQSTGQIVGGVIGAVIGFYWGGGNWQLGYAIGSAIGGAIDPQVIKGPSIGDAQKQTSQAGVPRPVVYGHPAPFAGNIIDGDIKARKVIKETRQAKGGPITKEEHFLLTLGVRVCEGPIAAFVRIWRNGKCVYDVRALNNMPGHDGPNSAAVRKYYNEVQSTTAKFINSARMYLGTETQLPDPALEAIHGVGNTPYYRGTAYIVDEDVDVTDTRGAAAQYMFEVLSCGTQVPRADGEIYVSNSYVTGPSYYVVDGATSTIAQTGTAIGGLTSPVINPSKTLLYGISGGAIGYVTLEDGTWHALTAPGNASEIVMDGAETYIYALSFTDSDIKKYLAFDGSLVATTAMLSNPGAMCTNIGQDTIYAAMYTNARYYVYNMATASALYVDTGTRALNRACALNMQGTHLFLVGQDNGTTVPYVSIFQVSTGSLADEIALPGAAVGGAIAFNPNEQTFAVCNYNTTLGLVWIYDAFTFVLLDTIAVGEKPNALTYNSNGSRLYVTNGDSNTLSVINTATNEVMATVPVASNPSRLAIWPPPYVVATWIPLPDAPGFYYDPITDTTVGTSMDVPTVSDCENTSLRFVEEDIAARCDVPYAHIDFSALDPFIIPGFLVSEQMPGADVLNPCQRAFFHDLPEVDGQILAVLRGGATKFDLTDDNLLDVGDDEPTTRPQEIEFPARVSVITQDPDADYSPIPQTSYRFTPDVKATSEVIIQLPIPFKADASKQIADKLHKVLWSQAEARTELSLPEEYSIRIVSDCFTWDNRRWLMGECNFADGEMKIKASYDRASNYTSTATGNPITPGQPPVGNILGPTRFMALNLPSLRAEDSVPGCYLAAQGIYDGWAGADIYLSTDGGLTEYLVLSMTQASVMGIVSVDEPSFGEPITVHLFDADDILVNVTAAQVLQGRNAAAIVSPTDVSELIGFETADQISNGDWELSTITRGGLETVEVSHLTGQPFTLLDRVYFLALDPALAGTTLIFRPVTIGTAPDNNPTLSFLFTPYPIIIDGGEIT